MLQTLTPTVNMNDCQTQAMFVAADSYSASAYDMTKPWLMDDDGEPLCCC